jgi:hypothetical protein
MALDFDAAANAVMPILMRQSDAFNEWTLEYPGFIALRTDGGGLWAIGTANGTWGADHYIAEDAFCAGESPDHSIDTGLPVDYQDAEGVALALFDAMVNLSGEAR